MFRVARYGGFTAAAGVLAAFVGVTMFSGREAAAFERVVAQVAKADSVRFLNIQRFGDRELPVRFSTKGDKVRMEFPGGAGAIISDLSEGRGIQLNHAKKEAEILTAGRWPGPTSPRTCGG